MRQHDLPEDETRRPHRQARRDQPWGRNKPPKHDNTKHTATTPTQNNNPNDTNAKHNPDTQLSHPEHHTRRHKLEQTQTHIFHTKPENHQTKTSLPYMVCAETFADSTNTIWIPCKSTLIYHQRLPQYRSRHTTTGPTTLARQTEGPRIGLTIAKFYTHYSSSQSEDLFAHN